MPAPCLPGFFANPAIFSKRIEGEITEKEEKGEKKRTEVTIGPL